MRLKRIARIQSNVITGKGRKKYFHIPCLRRAFAIISQQNDIGRIVPTLFTSTCYAE